MDVGDGEDFGRGIDDDRYVVPLGGFRNNFRAERPFVAWSGQDIDQRGAFVEGLFQLVRIVDLNDRYTKHANGVIVDVARIFRDDDFVFQPRKIGHALHALGIRARNTSRGEMRQGGAAAGSDNAPGSFGQLGKLLADAGHQLVHLDIAARGLVHGLFHFRKRLRARNDREGAARIDHGLYADRSIDLGGLSG